MVGMVKFGICGSESVLVVVGKSPIGESPSVFDQPG